MAAPETEKKNLMTYEGLKKLENELEELRTVRRKEVSQKIKEAREQGDLSENAEYDAAMDEQRDIEARIEEIQKILKHAEVVDEEEVSTDAVGIGCRVKNLNLPLSARRRPTAGPERSPMNRRSEKR